MILVHSTQLISTCKTEIPAVVLVQLLFCAYSYAMSLTRLVHGSTELLPPGTPPRAKVEPTKAPPRVPTRKPTLSKVHPQLVRND